MREVSRAGPLPAPGVSHTHLARRGPRIHGGSAERTKRVGVVVGLREGPPATGTSDRGPACGPWHGNRRSQPTTDQLLEAACAAGSDIEAAFSR